MSALGPRGRACYLAGPMRGRGQVTTERTFEECAEALRFAGWHVLRPSTTLARGADAVREVARRDLGMVLSLAAEDGDAVVLLQGWELSTGAQAEVAVARWLGLRTLLFAEALLDDAGEVTL